MLPFEDEAQLERLARILGPVHGAMILFGAATGLRPGERPFELSPYMGTILINIHRPYGHLARDGIQHAIVVLDGRAGAVDVGGRSVDVAPTPGRPTAFTEVPL